MSPEYLAGFFDGEGCIDCQYMYPKQAPGVFYVRPRLRVTLADVGRAVLEDLQKTYGGHLYHRSSKKATQSDSTSWELATKQGIKNVLVTISPYLIIKREQALLVMWWLDNASGGYSGRGHRTQMTEARKLFADEVKLMKRDPQRLSERAVEAIIPLMR
jgi:LAGLIDADG endonuclease